MTLYKTHYPQRNLHDESSSHDYKSKTDFYKERLSKAFGDQKELFKCVNELLNCTKWVALPSHSSKTELADDMEIFFLNKVKKIGENLDNI